MATPILKLNGTPLCNYPLQSASLALRAGGPDQLDLEFAAGKDTTPAFAYNDIVILTAHDPDPESEETITLFKGRCHPPRRFDSLPDIGYTITSDGAWGDLEAVTLQTSTKSYDPTSGELETVDIPRVLLGQATDGTLQATGATIGGIISYAAANSANITKGTILAGRDVPTTEVVDTKCADALRQYLRFHPDAVAWIEDGQTMHVQKAENLTTLTISNELNLWDVNVTKRDDRAPTGYKIVWEITHQVDGEPRLERRVDSAGNLNTWPPPVVHTISLAGASVSYAREVMETRTLPDPDDTDTTLAKNFFRGFFPGLSAADVADIGISDYEIALINPLIDEFDEDEEEPVNPNSRPFDTDVDLGDFPRQVVSGQVQEWMKGEPEQHEARITGKITYTGGNAKVKKLVGTGLEFDEPIQVTDAFSRIYSEVEDFELGETPIAGLAQDYYDAIKTPQYEGTMDGVLTWNHLLIRPGKKVLIPDEFDTASTITETTLDLLGFKHSTTFGINQFLTPAEVSDLQSSLNVNPPKYSRPEERTLARPPVGNKPVSSGSRPPNRFGAASVQKSARYWGLEVIDAEEGTVKITNPGTLSRTSDVNTTGVISIDGIDDEYDIAVGDYLAIQLDDDLAAEIVVLDEWDEFPYPYDMTDDGDFKKYANYYIPLYKGIAPPATPNARDEISIGEALSAKLLAPDSSLGLYVSMDEEPGGKMLGVPVVFQDFTKA